MSSISRSVFGTTLLIFVTVLFSCGDDEVVTPFKQQLPAEVVLAPDSVAISDCHFTLETYLWRDFMPIAPPDGRALIAALYVVEVDDKIVPQGLDINHLWVIYENNVWSTGKFDNQHPKYPPHEIRRVARDGPKWGPGVDVDVVVRLSGSDGIYWYIKAKDQRIHRTD